MKLSGKTAVVTGGGTGIGLAIARSLAAEGCRVALGGRRQEPLDQAIAQTDAGPTMIGHTLDVSDRQSVGQFFAWAHEQLGKVDILIQSAGINIPNRTMEAMQPEDWDRVLGINTTGAYNCAHAVLPGMKAQGDGLIVFISSVSGRRATALGGVAYTAAKFAQTALGKALALEVGDQGIRVTNVCPGEVNTPILDNRPAPVSDEHKARVLQPEDLADAVLMVACLPPRAHISELVIKPTWQEYT